MTRATASSPRTATWRTQAPGSVSIGARRSIVIDGYVYTVPVGKFDPRPNFKFYDMVGNAREWTQDCYASYAGVHTDGRAWEPADKVGSCARVLRGGSWINFPRYQRPANRSDVEPGFWGNDTGFRLARTLFTR